LFGMSRRLRAPVVGADEIGGDAGPELVGAGYGWEPVGCAGGER